MLKTGLIESQYVHICVLKLCVWVFVSLCVCAYEQMGTYR